MSEDLIFRLRKRAEIRRNIPSRKSVTLGEPDRIANLLDEAALELENFKKERDAYRQALRRVAEPYWELSYDKIRLQRDEYKNIAQKVLDEYWGSEEKEEPTEMDDNF